MHLAQRPEDEAAAAAKHFVRLTHPVKDFGAFVDLFSRSLHRVLNGQSLKEASAGQ